MKTVTALIFVCLVALSTTTHAFSLRFGSTLINEGKPATLLLLHLGEPLNKSISDICASHNRQGECRHWTTSEIWFYRHNEINYTIHIYSGIIQKIEWSRF